MPGTCPSVPAMITGQLWSIIMKATMLRSIPSLGVQSRNSEKGQNGGRPIPVLTIIPRLDVTVSPGRVEGLKSAATSRSLGN